MKDKEKQIEEMAKDKQWQRRDNYCLRIQKALQYKGTNDNEDVPSILVDFENEIRKEISEDSVVLSREEYDNLKLEIQKAHNKGVQAGFDMTNFKEESIKRKTRKETAEKIFDSIFKLEAYDDGWNKLYYKERIENLAKQFGVEIKE